MNKSDLIEVQLNPIATLGGASQVHVRVLFKSLDIWKELYPDDEHPVHRLRYYETNPKPNIETCVAFGFEEHFPDCASVRGIVEDLQTDNVTSLDPREEILKFLDALDCLWA